LEEFDYHYNQVECIREAMKAAVWSGCYMFVVVHLGIMAYTKRYATKVRLPTKGMLQTMLCTFAVWVTAERTQIKCGRRYLATKYEVGDFDVFK